MMLVQLRLLGEIEVVQAGKRIDIGHARQQCVLVVLAVEARRSVSVSQLVTRVWGEDSPLRARNTLYGYLHHLRSALAGTARIHRGPGGYFLDVSPAAVDMHRFRALVAEARAHDDESVALDVFEHAFRLWRGIPFTGMESAWLDMVRDALELELLDARLDYHDLVLRQGQHAELLPSLFELVGAHPMDERLAGQFMLALHRSGRSAAAFEHFQRLRSRLADELGIDPGRALQQTYQQLLTGTSPAPAQVSAAGRELPPPALFPGRARRRPLVVPRS